MLGTTLWYGFYGPVLDTGTMFDEKIADLCRELDKVIGDSNSLQQDVTPKPTACTAVKKRQSYLAVIGSVAGNSMAEDAEAAVSQCQLPIASANLLGSGQSTSATPSPAASVPGICRKRAMPPRPEPPRRARPGKQLEHAAPVAGPGLSQQLAAMMTPVSARLTKLRDDGLLSPELHDELHNTITDASMLLSRCAELATLVHIIADGPQLARQLARRS